MNRIIGTALLWVVVTAATAFGQYEIGDAVQDFTLEDLEGNQVSLYDFLGDIIVLNFFATWCPGCNEEAFFLEHEIWQVYQDKGVQVVAVD